MDQYLKVDQWKKTSEKKEEEKESEKKEEEKESEKKEEEKESEKKEEEKESEKKEEEWISWLAMYHHVSSLGEAPNGDCIIIDHFKRGGKKVD